MGNQSRGEALSKCRANRCRKGGVQSKTPIWDDLENVNRRQIVLRIASKSSTLKIPIGCNDAVLSTVSGERVANAS